MSRYKNTRFFNSRGICYAHSDRECYDCEEESKSSTALVTTVVDKHDSSWIDKEQARESFDNQTQFVKLALDYSDVALDKVKVKDLPKLVAEGKEKITVGKMKKLMENNKATKPSVVITLLKKIAMTMSRK